MTEREDGKNPAGEKVCPDCRGTGKKEHKYSNDPMLLGMVLLPCPACQGIGKVPSKVEPEGKGVDDTLRRFLCVPCVESDIQGLCKNYYICSRVKTLISWKDKAVSKEREKIIDKNLDKADLLLQAKKSGYDEGVIAERDRIIGLIGTSKDNYNNNIIILSDDYLRGYSYAKDEDIEIINQLAEKL